MLATTQNKRAMLVCGFSDSDSEDGDSEAVPAVVRRASRASAEGAAAEGDDAGEKPAGRQARSDAARHVVTRAKELWMEGAQNTDDLYASWKSLPELPRAVLRFTHLKHIYLIGNRLTDLPAAFSTTFPLLTVLVLNNNALRSLPDDLGALQNLEELALTRNELTELPDSICTLTKLKVLTLANNALRRLPDAIGELQALPAIVCESNRLCTLPPSFARLRCSTVNLNRNAFKTFPRALLSMSAIQRLLLNHNRLTALPVDIGSMRTLQALQLCNNLLWELPASIGELPSLQRIWCDWNNLTHLPLSMARLAQLVAVKAEGNPMLLPSLDVLAAGTDSLRAWCAVYVDRPRARESEAMVRLLLSAVADCARHKLVDAGHLAFGGTRPAGELVAAYHATTWQSLHAAVLPAVRAWWARRRDGKTLPTWSLEQVRGVLTSFMDYFGPILIEPASISFQQCHCVDGSGQAVACAYPGADGRSCNRPALLLKMTLHAVGDALRLQQRRVEDEQLILEAAQARVAARDWFASRDGAARVSLLALEAALIRAGKTRPYVEVAEEKAAAEAAAAKSAEAARRAKAEKRLNKALATQRRMLEKERGNLAKKRRKLRRKGKPLELVDLMLDDVEADLAALPERVTLDDEESSEEEDSSDSDEESEGEAGESGWYSFPRQDWRALVEGTPVDIPRKHRLFRPPAQELARLESELRTLYYAKTIKDRLAAAREQYELLRASVLMWTGVPSTQLYFAAWKAWVKALRARKRRNQLRRHFTWQRKRDPLTHASVWVHNKLGIATSTPPAEEESVCVVDVMDALGAGWKEKYGWRLDEVERRPLVEGLPTDEYGRLPPLVPLDAEERARVMARAGDGVEERKEDDSVPKLPKLTVSTG
eukprot:PLAT11343.1.p1 GENE.PLAT11343.1~~PLAT11343.1.p1  ORF type:complete len:884 (+),score=365.15 PLAT11343.1:790-3441(+)